ncbi:hypothetical protein G7Z17_g3438 [Cylindrodendrum hubeiense]|uniref:Uncharacterized protein n=1 Tax=Cylindrodendrum hubeiense TaxID=595255 RepID=A0A9P5HFW3_9HYPO|nr:hypothetical protein G7Z17_g3438 [Cylindrodendrum hubeiense]
MPADALSLFRSRSPAASLPHTPDSNPALGSDAAEAGHRPRSTEASSWCGPDARPTSLRSDQATRRRLAP